MAAGLFCGLVLLSLAQLHIYFDRWRDRNRVHEGVAQVVEATNELMADISTLRADFDAVQSRLGEKNFLHAEKLAGQVALIEVMVKQLAEEAARREFSEPVAPVASVAPVQPVAPAQPEAETGGPDVLEPVEGVHKFGGGPTAAPEPIPAPSVDPEQVDLLRASLATNRVDLYLQPIVTLPQRKVRYYEALSRIRREDGEIVLPGDYMSVAEAAGFMPMIDNLLLFRSVGVVRRLIERKREVGVFCNISTHSLLDAEFFPQFIEFMELNKELSSAVVFEFSQKTYAELGPIELESLEALASMGFRFSMDHITQLDLDFSALRASNFSFIKINANLLLTSDTVGGAQIVPDDLSALAARHSIEVIVEKIESEHTVVNLLDFNISFGQGFLFAHPRLVRDNAEEDLARQVA
ncbi:MAG: EAL domain-containing protein [Alphaproteobacteria bacterium]